MADDTMMSEDDDSDMKTDEGPAVEGTEKADDSEEM